MPTVGYIEIEFTDALKQKLKALVAEITETDDLYYSDVVSRIQGDVTNKLHFTLFFGLAQHELENPKLIKLIKKIDLGDLILDKLELFAGYKDLYQVLTISVNDEDGQLKQLHQQFLQFDCDEEMVHDEFRPHITLAYIVSDYKLPTNYVDLTIIAKPKGINMKKYP